MRGYSNSMGKSVSLTYKSSTKFYLADKAAGTPWATKLPFPVQCLERVTTTDAVSETSYSQRYSYHHGYYDHEEREFRGFGRVDALDIDGPIPVAGGVGAETIIPHQDPVLTKTWYHTGAWLREQTLLDAYEQEYYPFEGNRLLTCTIENNLGLSPREMREAYRALKGAALRQEVYAPDGSDKEDKPYAVTATAYTIRLLQYARMLNGEETPIVNGYAVFFSYQQQSLSWSTERNPDDARVAHSMTLNVDQYGNVLESASVVYPRTNIPSSLPDVVQQEQAKMHISYSVSQMAVFTDGSTIAADCDMPGHYRLRIPCESKAYEVTGADVPESGYWRVDDLHAACLAATEIGFTETATTGVLQKKQLAHSRVQYYIDQAAGAFGAYDIDALVYRQYSLAFTDDVLTDAFDNRVDDTMLAEGGYKRSADINGFPAADPADWLWLMGGVVNYSNAPQHFMQPVAFTDAFDQPAGGVDYWSDYYMLPYRAWDSLDNSSTVISYDWRVLQPTAMTDLNGNITEICYDVLGMPVAMAVKGKGDEADYLQNYNGLAFDADSEADHNLQADFWTDPEMNAVYLLGQATWRCVYDLESQPTAVAMIAREEHYVSDIEGRTMVRFSYSDGFGRVAMHKAQAVNDPDTDAVRWIGSGKTIYNNKGSVVMQFEPYYSPTHAYDPVTQAANLGISPRMHYDPLGRAFRTDMPDGTYTHTTWDGWSQAVYDANDNVLSSDWYAASINGAMGAEVQDAAEKAAKHANTPAVVHLDSLGRAFYTIQHNKTPDSSNVWQDEFIHSYAVLDIQGDRLAVVDGPGRTQLQYRYSQLKAPLWQQSIDGGEGRVLLNVAGQPYYSWDAEDRRFHITYDRLQRPLTKEVTAGGSTKMLERTVYGEDANGDNLRGKAIQQYDACGVSYIDQCAFNGVPQHAFRQMTADAIAEADWTTISSVTMDTDVYSAVAVVDALGRPKSQRTDVLGIDISGGGATLYDLRYDRKLAVLRTNNGTVYTEYDKAGVAMAVNVGNINGFNQDVQTYILYNAKGQTEAVWYDNGTKTSYTYDPQNYRVKRILTVFLDQNQILQDLNYWYDAAGNITQIQDAAQQTLFYNNTVVSPDQLFTYDALYRLIKAEGREQIGLATFGAKDNWDDAAWKTSHKGDGAGVQRYTQKYTYDVAGNVLSLQHMAATGSYTRTYDYTTGNNRLQSTTVGTDTYSYTHDIHGNMAGMPHLDETVWNVLNEMSYLECSTLKAWYQYSGGQRMRKYVNKGSIRELRLYLGNFEIYRKFDSGSSLILERTTLHVGPAMFEVRTYGSDDAPGYLARFSYSNHLGSAALELDSAAQIISYEEYHPYGTTSYQAMNASINAVAKRYRYTGKERDEESGLYYHGARYYACWLARWTAVDPKESSRPGLSGFNYCQNNPVMRHDPDGMQDKNKNLESKPAPTNDNTSVAKNPILSTPYTAPTGGHFMLPNDAKVTGTFSSGPVIINATSFGVPVDGSVFSFEYRGEHYNAAFDEKTKEFRGYYSQENSLHQINYAGSTLPGPVADHSFITRIEGAGKLLAGATEAIVGALGGAASSWTGVGAVAGGLAVVHGSDIAASGATQLITGESTQSFTEQGLSSGIQAMGVDPQKANAAAGNINMVLSTVLSGEAAYPSSQNSTASAANTANTITFYRGTAHYYALEAEASQALNFEESVASQVSRDFPTERQGIYLTSQQSTAEYYQSIEGLHGRAGGPATLKIEILQSDYERLATKYGIQYETPVPTPPVSGQTETLIPAAASEEFNKLIKVYYINH
jgi:RHS repeat-associated protein